MGSAAFSTPQRRWVTSFLATFLLVGSACAQTPSVPLDPKFGENGIARLALLTFGPSPWNLGALEDGRVSAYAAYGLNPALGAYDPRYAALGLLDGATGAPVPTFGEQGVASGFYQLKCTGEPATALANDGTLFLAVAGGGGSFCTINMVAVNRFSPSGDRLPGVNANAAGRPNSTPGLAPMADGRVLLGATEFDPATNTEKVIFNAVGPSGSEETYTWMTGIGRRTADNLYADTKLVIRRSAKGGFVAALVTEHQLKLLRLNDQGKPSDAWGLNMTAEGTKPSFQVQPTQLLDLVVTPNGDFALAVVERAGSIDIHRFFELGQGLLTQSKSSLPIDATQTIMGGFTRVGDFIGAASNRSNKITLYSHQAANGFRSWEWTPAQAVASKPIGSIGLWSMAVSPSDRSAIVSMALYEPNASQRFDAILAKFDIAKAVQSVQAVEFFNTTLKHYFVTASVAESNGIEAGRAGPGWVRTQLNFNVFDNAQTAPQEAAPVCRFYGTPGKGPNSHFYTFEGPECDAVKKDPGWMYEGVAFYSVKPNFLTSPRGCPNDYQHVYRAYNNRFAQNDSNHRYSTSLTELQGMPGWSVEGVVFCSPSTL